MPDQTRTTERPPWQRCTSTRRHVGSPDGHAPAVDRVTLDIADGEFLVLVGPSGCGKSTTLRMLAGLEPVDGGRILIDGHDQKGVRPRDRDIAMVFQSYALYPNMTAAQNMAFALDNAKVSKSETKQRVAEAAKILELEQFLDRKPGQMSGGQRQRVAMGRAIVRNPKVFCMDEPLSNLDAKLRVSHPLADRRAAAPARHHDGLRHPRPGRGDDDGPPGRGAARRQAAAGRHAGAALRPARSTPSSRPFIGSPAITLVESAVREGVAARPRRRACRSTGRWPAGRGRRSSSGCAPSRGTSSRRPGRAGTRRRSALNVELVESLGLGVVRLRPPGRRRRGRRPRHGPPRQAHPPDGR